MHIYRVGGKFSVVVLLTLNSELSDLGGVAYLGRGGFLVGQVADGRVREIVGADYFGSHHGHMCHIGLGRDLGPIGAAEAHHLLEFVRRKVVVLQFNSERWSKQKLLNLYLSLLLFFFCSTVIFRCVFSVFLQVSDVVNVV